MIETVHLFGQSINQSKSNIFYHNLQNASTYPVLSCYLCAPTSTTDLIEVALQQSSTKGIILEFVKENTWSNVKLFNCAWFSRYTDEHEILFISGHNCN